MIEWNGTESPLELARQLWHIPDLEALGRLPAERFRSLFDRVYQSTDDIEVLWQLGGATNDYLHANPDSISVPADLPRRLLASEHTDARIIGLKLLNRCAVTDQEIVQGIVLAMSRRDGYESCGAIHELANFLNQRYPSGTGLATQLVDQLSTALEPLIGDGVDVHASASYAMARLRGFQ